VKQIFEIFEPKFDSFTMLMGEIPKRV